MSISGINNSNLQNYYSASKPIQSNKADEAAKSSLEQPLASEAKKASEPIADVDTKKYLSDLQKKNSQINIIQGSSNTGRTASFNSKTDVMISPSILRQMASDPQAAMKYEKMLADIPALDKWADSTIKALTGSDVKYRQVWIDDNGNMGSFCITGPSEQTKKMQQQKERAEKIEEQQEKQRELAERVKSDKNNPLETEYLKDIMKLLSVNYRV